MTPGRSTGADDPWSDLLADVTGASSPGARRFDWERSFRAAGVGLRNTAVGLAMATYADGAGTNVRPGMAALAKSIGASERAVRNAKQELVALGWLTLTREGRHAAFQPDTYQLTLPPGASDDSSTERAAPPPAYEDLPGASDDGVSVVSCTQPVHDQSNGPVQDQPNEPVQLAARVQALLLDAERQEAAGYWDRAQQLMVQADRLAMELALAEAPSFD